MASACATDVEIDVSGIRDMDFNFSGGRWILAWIGAWNGAEGNLEVRVFDDSYTTLGTFSSSSRIDPSLVAIDRSGGILIATSKTFTTAEVIPFGCF